MLTRATAGGRARFLHSCIGVANRFNGSLAESQTAQFSSVLDPASALRRTLPRLVPQSELDEIRSMKSSDLRRLAQAAAAEGAHPAVLETIAERCEAFGEQMRYWDIVYVLQAFAQMRVDNRSLFLRMAEVLCTKTSKFAPKRILDLFAVYESMGLRPRPLYVELFHSTIRLSRSMYAEEVSLTLQAFARHRLGNPTVVAHLVSAVLRQLRDFRLRYLCGVTGALGSLEMVPDTMLTEFEDHAKFEVQTVAIQELLENLQAFPQLEFSWRPYEELCLDEFRNRVRTLRTAQDVGQFVDPFETMNFLRTRGLLEDSYLEALSQWCLLTVHRPNVLSERRPTSRQLFQLYDRCRESELQSLPALKDAIRYYVESGGGQWQLALPKPLAYNRKRRYLRTHDPLEDVVLPMTHEPKEVLMEHRPHQQPKMDDLPGLPSSDKIAVGAPVADELDLSRLPERSNRKKDAGETVKGFITSRKSVRPRHRRDPGLKKIFRKDMHRAPYYLMPGYASRPKYRPGVATKRTPYPDIPPGKGGAAWVLRR